LAREVYTPGCQNFINEITQDKSYSEAIDEISHIPLTLPLFRPYAEGGVYYGEASARISGLGFQLMLRSRQGGVDVNSDDVIKNVLQGKGDFDGVVNNKDGTNDTYNETTGFYGGIAIVGA
jgi:hypothetical protein